MESNPDVRFCWRASQKILTQVNWHVSFYCANEVCYTKY